MEHVKWNMKKWNMEHKNEILKWNMKKQNIKNGTWNMKMQHENAT